MTILYLLTFAFGTAWGAYLVKKFNPKDITYIIDKLRAKKGGVINVRQDNNTDEIEEKPEKKKRKIFNKINFRRNKK